MRENRERENEEVEITFGTKCVLLKTDYLILRQITYIHTHTSAQNPRVKIGTRATHSTHINSNNNNNVYMSLPCIGFSSLSLSLSLVVCVHVSFSCVNI